MKAWRSCWVGPLQQWQHWHIECKSQLIRVEPGRGIALTFHWKILQYSSIRCAVTLQELVTLMVTSCMPEPERAH